MLAPAVNVMVKAARAGGNVLLRHMHRLDALNVVEKDRMDYASEVDGLAEEAIIKELRRANPDYAILGEEGGAQKGNRGPSRYTWVIDPLDGTSNYLHGIPHWCVSLALCEGPEPLHAVVFDPLRNELFTASRGGGAQLNEKRIRVSERKDLSGAMLVTGFAPRERKHLDAQLDCMKLLMKDARTCAAPVRPRSTWLGLRGSLRCLFRVGVYPWDIAAGALLVREAGGGSTTSRRHDRPAYRHGHWPPADRRQPQGQRRPQKAIVASGYAKSSTEGGGRGHAPSCTP